MGLLKLDYTKEFWTDDKQVWIYLILYPITLWGELVPACLSAALKSLKGSDLLLASLEARMWTIAVLSRKIILKGLDLCGTRKKPLPAQCFLRSSAVFGSE